MTDPTLAALTEALRDTPIDLLEELTGRATSAEEFAAAILAHPAMADLARNAAAWDAVESGRVHVYLAHGGGYWAEWSSADGATVERRAKAATMAAAIAAALEQGDD